MRCERCHGFGGLETTNQRRMDCPDCKGTGKLPPPITQADIDRLTRERDEARTWEKAARQLREIYIELGPLCNEQTALEAVRGLTRAIESWKREEAHWKDRERELVEKNSLLIQTIERQRARERELLEALRSTALKQDDTYQWCECCAVERHVSYAATAFPHADSCIVKPAEEDPNEK